jgi:hypothetical protein
MIRTLMKNLSLRVNKEEEYEDASNNVVHCVQDVNWN